MRRVLRDRLITTLLVIWAACTLAFGLLQVIPGDAVTGQLLAGGASEAAIEARKAELGLNQPLLVRYSTYLAGLLRGDLGHSYINHQPVSALILQQLPATAALATAALVFAVSVGIVLGAIEALAWPRWPGRLANTLSLLALSTPIYWSATLAIYLVSTRWQLLPATGSSGPAHLVLPAAVLGFHVAGSIARVTHASLQHTMHATYIRTAHAKGLPPRTILLVHVLKPSLPPILSIIALQTGFLLGGAVVTEMIFVRQGLGQLLQHAVLDQDYPVVLGVVIFSAAVYSSVGALADLLHGILDPRIHQQTG
ncbi:MAG: ABC transporter permease [Anaerolineae bacterium]